MVLICFNTITGTGITHWMDSKKILMISCFKGINFYFGLHLAAFGDFGIAWDRRSQFTMDNFIDGFGFGFRFLIPYIDVIRLDFAYGEAGQGINRHIGLGWKADKQRLRVR